MGKINILSKEIINQIAAGEVIERPASVVKELLENSLDAGSRNISVEISGGGIDLIRMADNGHGMDKDELELAILRHATSKIHTTSDLFSIHTLGFRGEALPSILSVSRTIISTKTKESSHGYLLNLEAGEIVDSSIKGMPTGTIIEVRDLFFNTPARKKFLKTTATEQRNIIDIISRYAFVHPDKKFSLDINGRPLLNLRENSSLEERVDSILGKGLIDKLRPISRQTPEISIRGMCALPEVSRPSRSSIYIFVNNRAVKDQTLNSAILQGYQGMLMKGKYPVAILFVEIEPASVDVNVHPTKNEVRFKNPSAVFGIVAATVRDSLTTTSSHKTAASTNSNAFTGYEVRENTPPQYIARREPLPKTTVVYQENLFSHTPEPTMYSGMKVIGVLHSTYILLEDDSSLYILDQHASHERINYEKIKKIYSQANTQSQSLLSPLIIELSKTEYQAFDEIRDHMKAIGIDTDIFGDSAIAVRSIPSDLTKGDIRAIILELIHGVLDGVLKKKDYLDEIIATIACHKSITSGDTLTTHHITGILKDLDEIGSPLTCPHGRPLFKKITKAEIEKWIGRRP